MNKTNAPELIRVSSGALLVKLVFIVHSVGADAHIGPVGRQRRKSGASKLPLMRELSAKLTEGEIKCWNFSPPVRNQRFLTAPSSEGA